MNFYLKRARILLEDEIKEDETKLNVKKRQLEQLMKI